MNALSTRLSDLPSDQADALRLALRGGELRYWPGGYWARRGAATGYAPGQHARTPAVVALVRAGIMRWSKFDRAGPTAARLVQEVEQAAA